MSTLVEIRKNIQKLEREVSNLKKLAADSDEFYEQKKQETRNGYLRLFERAKRFLTKVTQEEELSLFFKEPFFNNFSPVFYLRNNVLCIGDQKVDALDFDCHSCFSVFENTTNRFEQCVTDCVKNWRNLTPTPALHQTIYEIAQSYNTVVAIYVRAGQMAEEAWSMEYQKLKKERDQATEKIPQCNAKIEKLTQELQERTEEIEKIKASLNFRIDSPAEHRFVTDFKIPLGYTNAFEEGSDEDPDLLLWTPTEQNILRITVAIENKSKRQQAVLSFLKNIMLRFLNAYPIGATRLMICDDTSFDDLNKDFINRITSGGQNAEEGAFLKKNLFLFPSENTESSQLCYFERFDNALDYVDELKKARDAHVLMKNKRDKDVYTPITLVVVNGYEKGSYEHDLGKQYSNGFFESCKNAGFFFVFVESDSEGTDYRGSHVSLDDCDAQLQRSVTLTEDAHGQLSVAEAQKSLVACQVSPHFDLKAYSADLLHRLKTAMRYIRLEDVLQDYAGEVKKDTFQETVIPIGKTDDGSFSVLTLSSTKKLAAHGIIAGGSGAGKSSLLQAIVLSSAYRYSPDDIEFYLIDLKNGKTFYDQDKMGALKYDYRTLKHVKMVSFNCKVQDISDFIRYIIDSKMQKAAPTSTDASVKRKRTVIIIDEYNEILEKGDDTLKGNISHILRQGRDYGISLIMSAQQFKTTSAKQNVGHIFEFQNNQYDLIDKLTRDASAVNYLKSVQGNCIYQWSGASSFAKLRIAYTPHQKELIESINQKYASYPASESIDVGGATCPIKPFERLCLASEEKAATGDAAVSVNIGKNIMGYDEYINFAESKTGVLLVGDEARTQHVEYSIIKRFCESHAQKAYYIAADQDHISADFRAASADAVEFMSSQSKIVRLIMDLYQTYEDRKQMIREAEDRECSVSELNFEPILVFFHGITQSRIANIRLAEKNFWAAQAKAEESDREAQKQASTVEARVEDGGEPDESAFMGPDAWKNFKAKHGKPTVRVFSSARNVIEKLKELIANGNEQCNIHFILYSDMEELTELRAVLDQSLSDWLKKDRAFLIPSLSDERASEKEFLISQKNKLLFALDKLEGKALEKILKADDQGITKQFLNRIYYLQSATDYAQILPYEWRNEK